jgi:hypothetical protein
MPMQKIEGIDEARQEAVANQQLALFEQQNPRVDGFRNRLTSTGNRASPSPMTGRTTTPAKIAASKPSAMPPTPIPLLANTSPASKLPIPLAAIPALP